MDFTRIRNLALAAPDEETIDILFVGRLVEQKNPLRFLELISKLKIAGWKDIRAVMLGAGELQPECEEFIRKHELNGNIEMAGFVDNPYLYMKQSKMLCMTSKWEGFGLVVLEANALGVPVLSTPTSGCLDILGMDVPEIYRNDAEFVDKALHLRDCDDVYGLWKARAIERAEKFDNIQAYMDCIQQIYRNED